MRLGVTSLGPIFVVLTAAWPTIGWTQPIPAGSPAITRAELDGTNLFIYGHDFGIADAPVVVLGTETLTVSSYAPSTIVAEVPASVSAGTYGLTVESFAAPSQGSPAWAALDVTIGAVGPQGPQGPPGTLSVAAGQQLTLAPAPGNAPWRIYTQTAQAPNTSDQVLAFQYNWHSSPALETPAQDVPGLGSVSFQFESYWDQSRLNPPQFEWNLDFGDPATGAWADRALAFSRKWDTGAIDWKFSTGWAWGLLLDASEMWVGPRLSAPRIITRWGSDTGRMTRTSPGVSLDDGEAMRIGLDNPSPNVAYLRSNVVVPESGVRAIKLGHSLASAPDVFVDDFVVDLTTRAIPGRVSVPGSFSAGSVQSGITPASGARAHFLSESDNSTPSYWTPSTLVVGRAAGMGPDSGGVFLMYNTILGEGVVGALSPSTAWRPLKLSASRTEITSKGARTVASFDAAGVRIGASGAPISSSLRATAFLRTVQIAPGVCASDQAIVVAGALPGAECAVGMPPTIESALTWSCFVSAADEVKLRVCNHSNAAISPAASQSAAVRVFNP